MAKISFLSQMTQKYYRVLAEERIHRNRRQGLLLLRVDSNIHHAKILTSP